MNPDDELYAQILADVALCVAADRFDFALPAHRAGEVWVMEKEN